ncbi:MAG: DoxX family protein [Melioribacteraceae bacterium]|nr:DoxX family protein [Melioribacteraceae bacterium]
METIISIIQLVIALGILNVWILRFGKSSTWRGGEAKNMKEEFQVYGLPSWFVGVVGFLKVLFALMLIVGLWLPTLVQPAAIGIALLMLGAIVMHTKVKDPATKSLPAFSLLILSVIIAFF